MILQTCPHCKFVNKVYGKPSKSGSEGQSQPPQLWCGKCGKRFPFKESIVVIPTETPGQQGGGPPQEAR
jgi:hypothetical protein